MTGDSQKKEKEDGKGGNPHFREQGEERRNGLVRGRGRGQKKVETKSAPGKGFRRVRGVDNYNREERTPIS